MPLDTVALASIAAWAFVFMAFGASKQPFNFIGWSALALIAVAYAGGVSAVIVRTGELLGEIVGGLLRLVT